MPLRKQQLAFSLIEVVTSLGVFTFIMLGTVLIMAQGTRSYKGTKVIQNNLETIQFVLNTVSKELRTSSVVGSSLGATTSTITFYDYSQSRCIQYQADETSGTFSRRSRAFTGVNPDANRSSCLGYSFTESYETLLTGLSVQAMNVVRSRNIADASGPMVGRVTILLTVGTGGAAASAQTTVSLRDFNYIGI